MTGRRIVRRGGSNPCGDDLRSYLGGRYPVSVRRGGEDAPELLRKPEDRIFDRLLHFSLETL